MSTMQVTSGRVFDLAKPDPLHISIYDIAGSLSRISRFGGHTRADLAPYSVAQHSVLVSMLVETELHDDAEDDLIMTALLHDAAEAYTGDCIRPLKRELGASFAELEQRLEFCIATRFGLTYPFPPIVKQVDNRIMVNEVRDLMAVCADAKEWNFLKVLQPYDIPIIRPWSWDLAYEMFMSRFVELNGDKVIEEVLIDE